MKQWITYRRFAYLKTPLFSWTVENDMGGSFSNSGMHKSAKKCIEHSKATNKRSFTDIRWVDVDADGNETRLEHKLETI